MNIKQKVETVLEKYTSTRDSDQLLILMVWWYFHQDKMRVQDNKWWVELSEIRDLEKTESITRVRRKIQNDEKRFPASQEVEAKRRRYEEDMRQSMPNFGWEQAEFFNDK